MALSTFQDDLLGTLKGLAPAWATTAEISDAFGKPVSAGSLETLMVCVLEQRRGEKIRRREGKWRYIKTEQ